MYTQQLADKENQGVPENWQNEEPRRVVSILKSSQKVNCPLEKKFTKVSTFDASSEIKSLFTSSMTTT